MATADQLLELMFSWINQRELSAEQLRKLARELESLRKKCNISECAGNSVSVVGAACVIGAGAATVFTGGAAIPILAVLGAVFSGTGVTISVVTKITEHFLSSNTMKEAQKIEEKSNDIAEEIQKLFKQLKEERKEGSSFTDDELDRHVMNKIMGAVARRSGLSNDFIDSMYKCMLDDNGQHFYLIAEQGNMLNHSFLNPHVMVALAGILSFFAFKGSGKKYNLLFAEGSKQLIKQMSKTGFKTALKGGAMVVGGAVGMAFALPEAIDKWKDLIENNYVTEASQSLRDTADEILKMTRTLKGELDNIKKALRSARVKLIIENTKRSLDERKRLIKFAIENCKNETVVQWLRENSESEAFFKLVEMFNFLKKHIDEEEKKNHSNSVDITFVAHGAIEDSMIPASCLLPLSAINDVLLYSPWNCTMDFDAVYGVATGRIQPQHRAFECGEDGCQVPDEKHQPTKLPNHWNSMKRAGDQMIPNITLSPFKPDGFWKSFESRTKRSGQPERNRIVIPFILPAESDSSGSVPFFVVTLAFSLVLVHSRFQATIHLAACLGDQSAGQKFDKEYLKTQYACTVDNTHMTCSPDMFTVSWIDDFKRLFG